MHYQLRFRLSCLLVLCLLSSSTIVVPRSVAQPSATITAQPRLKLEGLLNEESQLSKTGQRVNLHTFEGKAGEKLSIDLGSNEFAPVTVIVGVDSKPIIREDGYQNFNSVLSIVIPISGQYTIGVFSKQPKEMGSYRLEVRVSNPSDLALAEARNLNQQVLKHFQDGTYLKGILVAEQALKIRKQYLGDRHPDVATSLHNLALLCEKEGQYEKSEDLYLQALKIQKFTLGDRHILIATSLSNLAGLYESLGQHEKSEDLYLQALEMQRSLLGNSHRDIASSLNNLAGLYDSMEYHEKSEDLYLQALEMQRSLFGNSHRDIASSLNNLAALYRNQGRFEKAESFYIQALEMRKSLLGDRHPDVATSLNNLAELYWYWRKDGYKKAETSSLQALSIYKSIYGEKHLLVALTLNNLAESYISQERYTEAENYARKSLEIRKDILGDQHPDIATNLNNLAGLYLAQGKYAEAENLYFQALNLLKSFFGDRHPKISATINNLAALYTGQGKYEKAINYLEQGMQLEEKKLVANLAIGAEEQKRDYLTKFNGTTNSSISLHLQHVSTNSKAINLAFTNILRRKGRILGTLTNNLSQIRQNLTPPDQAQLDEFSSTQTQLATLYHKGLRNLSSNKDRARITELEQKSTQLSEALSRRSAAFQTAIKPITSETIQQQIPTDTVLIEFIQYQPFNPNAKSQERWGNPRYAAYLLTHSGILKAIDLGPVQPINDILISHRQHLQDLGTPIPQLKASASKLDALLMQPIRQHLGNVRNLLLSPESTLNLLPFDTLVDENNNYLIETHNITYLASGRDLQRLTTQEPNNNPSLILADPYFGKPGTLAASTSTTRLTDLTKQTYSPLQGTRPEAISIATLFNTQPRLGSDATEATIKQTKSPKILHIATHGFFLPTPETAKTNPLLNSGLVLAGVQVGKSGGTEDGILTALEVSNLNLSGTKLVTLSACDTGLGTISNGEGIYGLRRALTIAGAESQVISLWKVADDATKDLMINYYSRLKKGGEGRSIALHNAQRHMLNSEKYSHPYYWAAFIPSGDWRPIENK
jgi:CHAT domain-containing protein/Tfp pilus assembly protein PilF